MYKLLPKVWLATTGSKAESFYGCMGKVNGILRTEKGVFGERDNYINHLEAAKLAGLYVLHGALALPWRCLHGAFATSVASLPCCMVVYVLLGYELLRKTPRVVDERLSC